MLKQSKALPPLGRSWLWRGAEAAAVSQDVLVTCNQVAGGGEPWLGQPPKHSAAESCSGFEAEKFRQGRLSPASVTFQSVALSKVFSFCKSCLIYKQDRTFFTLQGCERFHEIMRTTCKKPNT